MKKKRVCSLCSDGGFPEGENVKNDGMADFSWKTHWELATFLGVILTQRHRYRE